MNQMQVQMPPLSKTNKYLMIVTGALFLLESILVKTTGVSLATYFGLSAAGVEQGLIFQLLTYPLIERQLLAVIFNGLLLWFLGSELESMWGTKRYIQFLLASAITAALIYLMIGFLFLSETSVYSFPLMGLQGLAAALCVAYGILYPDRIFTFMLIFPMKAKWFCALLVAMELYTGFFSPMGALAWGHLAAIVGGFGMLLQFTKSKKQKRSSGNFAFKMEKKKGKAHLSLVEEEEDDSKRPPKYWQ